MSKSEKMYKDSPKLKRNEESGKVGVEKPTPADADNMGLKGETGDEAQNAEQTEMPVEVNHANERHQLHHRHITEHLQQHARHEHEHALAGKTDKKLVHKKHEAEHKAMVERHHEELKTMHRRHEKAANTKESPKQAGTEAAKIEKETK